MIGYLYALGLTDKKVERMGKVKRLLFKKNNTEVFRSLIFNELSQLFKVQALQHIQTVRFIQSLLFFGNHISKCNRLSQLKRH